MKARLTYLIILSLLPVASFAQEKDVPTFTTICQVPITPVKNQNKSGTCWDYATTGFFEAEILRQKGKVYDLSEMYFANKDYMDCAEYHIRLHGDSRFSEGGSADDVLEVMRRWGACPEEAMARPGSLVGDTLANFNEFFPLMDAYVSAVAKSESKKLSTQWKAGLQGIIDAYIGKCPEKFTYEGKTYTPMTFFQTLGLNLDDYVSLTSFTHHSFRTSFILEAPYKWRPRPSYNIPLDELMAAIDNALKAGYTVCWGGDVSGEDFSRSGLASLHDETPEMAITQQSRQERFDNWQSTYDHVMLIYGMAKDKNGRDYYMVKNSWGDTGKFHGTWYMSRNYIAMYTYYIFLNKHALKGKNN